MRYLRELTALCLVFALASFSAGCSFSYSSDSSSDSSTSSSDSSNNSSESSSGSSFDDDKDHDDGEPVDTSYRDDVSDYMAAAYVAGLKSAESGAAAAAGATPDPAADSSPAIDVAAFRKGLSGIAAQYGIVGWESDEVTYTGIGIGLAKAGLPQRELATYSQALTDQDAAKDAAIERGYGQQS
jgi:hypothetical protein